MLAFGMPNMSEWLVILVIIMIFFGAGRLPDVLKQFGKGVKEFKDASEGVTKKGSRDEEDEDEPVAKRSTKQLGADAASPDDAEGDNDDAGATPVQKGQSRSG